MPFVKGRLKTGGRKKGVPNKNKDEIKQMLLYASPMACMRLQALSNHQDPNIALKATETILAYGIGKPVTTQILEGGENPIKQETTINGKDARDELIRKVDKMADNLASPTKIQTIEPEEKAIH